MISNTKVSVKDPVESLLEIQLEAHKNSLNKPKNKSTSNMPRVNSECLLQNIDIYRLKALVYRDVVRNDKNKAKPYVIVVCFNYFFHL